MKYYARHILARGSFSEVLFALDENQKPVAVKRISRVSSSSSSTSIARAVNRERKILHLLNGVDNHIVQLIDDFDDDSAFYMVFDYLEGTDLLKFILERQTPLDESDVRQLFLQLAKALSAVHKKGIVHNDLKCENIIVDKNTMKTTLIDFGLSEMPTNNGMTNSNSGSLPYMCPNKFTSHLDLIPAAKTMKFDGFKSDVWSLGVILFAALFREFPWSIDERKLSISNKNAHPSLNFPNSKRIISNQARDLLQGMMHVNFANRLSIDQVLSHPWITGVTAAPVLIDLTGSSAMVVASVPKNNGAGQQENHSPNVRVSVHQEIDAACEQSSSKKTKINHGSFSSSANNNNHHSMSTSSPNNNAVHHPNLNSHNGSGSNNASASIGSNQGDFSLFSSPLQLRKQAHYNNNATYMNNTTANNTPTQNIPNNKAKVEINVNMNTTNTANNNNNNENNASNEIQADISSDLTNTSNLDQLLMNQSADASENNNNNNTCAQENRFKNSPSFFPQKISL